MCCVVSLEVLFYIKQKIIHHTKQQVNKGDNEMTSSDEPELRRRPPLPPNFEYQSGGTESAHSSGHRSAVLSVFFFFFFFMIAPFPLTLWGSGGGGVGSLCACSRAHCPSNRSLKCSSGLQLFSISNRSDEQQYGLFLFPYFYYVLCFLLSFPFFFFLFFFYPGWWLAEPRGGSSTSRCSGDSLTRFWIFPRTVVTLVRYGRGWGPQREKNVRGGFVFFSFPFRVKFLGKKVEILGTKSKF